MQKESKSYELECVNMSSNCNPKSNIITFLNDGLICYASSNQVYIYDINKNTILVNIHEFDTDPQHYSEHHRVNCIKSYIKAHHIYLLVGYDTGYIIAFYCHITQLTTWHLLHRIKQPSNIISIEVIKSPNDDWYIFTNNNAGDVTMYVHSGAKSIQKVESFAFPLNKLIQSICPLIIEEHLVVFVAGVDQKIHCYIKHLQPEHIKHLQAEQKQEMREGMASDSKLEYVFSLVGHENAINKLTITAISNGEEYLLASCSKDGYIRIWRITSNLEIIKFHKNVQNLLTTRRVFLDAVLISHESSVTSLCWAQFQHLNLVSCSLDCTVCIWGCGEDGSWSVDNRMGQFLGNKNAYFDVVTNASSNYIVAVNYIGSALIWKYQSVQNRFTLRESFNGHSNEVKDIQWNHTGDFLVSVSKDQTTRVIAKNHQESYYHEISRAQIHGYDINAVTVLNVNPAIIDLIACGADQKVVRIIEPPACFANYLNTFTKSNLHLFFSSVEDENKYLISKPNDSILMYETYSEGGVQVLGLMTKMQRIQRENVTNYYDEELMAEEQETLKNQEHSPDQPKDSTKIDFTKAPHDDYLVKHTLWPEMNKLYGHPHQIQALSRSNNRPLMASSCAAITKQAASIIIWDTELWKIRNIIPFHSYTVYSMEFSFLDNYLVSVSKDRKLAVFNKEFELIFSYEAHSRAITSVSIDRTEQFIVTGSRDKTIKVHSISQKKIIAEHLIQFPVTSVAFAIEQNIQNLIAFGTSQGKIGILMFQSQKQHKFTLLTETTIKNQHTNSINSLKWNKNLLASCSDDFSVKIFELIQKS